MKLYVHCVMICTLYFQTLFTRALRSTKLSSILLVEMGVARTSCCYSSLIIIVFFLSLIPAYYLSQRPPAGNIIVMF